MTPCVRWLTKREWWLAVASLDKSTLIRLRLLTAPATGVGTAEILATP